ncbi:MAG: hypothetical protein A2268_08830 [Candidatus Raymondbacteria bacterium RifOxyA12_full_50_37]|uniref:Uncharacterized protein n=1 Tax=Candidatus Raymondbacteria bacterium RIFOXYD12_FULL_49_13 TaxID=1817890 RepID=A0A1F7FGI5_UNCRA|nr:MAG: hypothetical protein A2350_19750 [Candidatus Raymondbacteria bacterium RifOxyB12_full_50_8]OGJ91597.1 MAG: hypothetical protein A2268_08830 [Candidatus Raymondbacteria bacterium RifOxyA12_full_50_37]OGJ92903.1 MAG: hypothetical protein A2248_08530 [Candidatus Raymondbacteria bacterium RIFOXYA2_FULL_49_16]OGJ94830.1 MAG: hypothetical protein A2487_03230 [Candidatus Raymondbacteria bacterium RifOxyC12_full_50_8]OGK05711.1 MAG: hypothetical protein A2519_03940 [Candidatus Raymondbacteria b
MFIQTMFALNCIAALTLGIALKMHASTEIFQASMLFITIFITSSAYFLYVYHIKSGTHSKKGLL